MLIRLIALAGVMVLTGCASTAKPPLSPLPAVAQTRSVQTLWVAPAGARSPRLHSQLAPTVRGPHLYLVNASGELGALDAANGALQWRLVIDAPFSSPLGVDDTAGAVGTRDARVFLVDSKQGTLLWEARVSSEVVAAPLVLSDRVVVQTVDGRVTALDRADGRRLWSYERRVPSLSLRGTAAPIAVADAVLTAFADGHFVALNVRTGEPFWETAVAVPRGRNELDRMVDVDGQFRVQDGVVYVATYQGRIAALELRSGEVIWSRDFSSYAGLDVAQGQIYVSDAAGHVWALDRTSGATLWRQEQLAGREITGPAVMDDAIVVADRGGIVHWLAADDGRFLARARLEDAFRRDALPAWYPGDAASLEWDWTVTAPLGVAERNLYVRDNDGAVTAYRFAPATPR